MPNIGLFTDATIASQLKGISDAIVNDNQLLMFLKEKNVFRYNRGGDGFKFRVRYQGSSIGGASSDWDQRVAQTTAPVTTIGAISYRQYQWQLTHSIFQEQRNQYAGPEAKMFDMVMEQLSEVKQQASNRIGTHMYGSYATSSTTGDTGTPVDGLEDIIGTSNTYAGVARSSNAYWQAQVVTQASATFNLDSDGDGQANGIDAMDQLWNACSKGMQPGGDDGSIPTDLAKQKDEPEYIVTTDTGYRLYKKCLMSQVRYTGGAVDGHQDLLYNSVPIKWDSFCTASRFYFLNSKHLSIDVVGPQLLSLPVDQQIPSPLVRIRALISQLQFYSRNPRYLGSLQLT